MHSSEHDLHSRQPCARDQDKLAPAQLAEFFACDYRGSYLENKNSKDGRSSNLNPHSVATPADHPKGLDPKTVVAKQLTIQKCMTYAQRVLHASSGMPTYGADTIYMQTPAAALVECV